MRKRQPTGSSPHRARPTGDAPLGVTPAALTALLARVSREALQGDGLDAVMQRIVASLVQQLPVTVASIILLDDDCRNFVEEVSAGSLDLDIPAAFPWPVSVGAAGRCARTGRAELISDVDNDPDYVSGNRAVRAEYLVPIRHRERLHGVLNIESTFADFFSVSVRHAFDAVADQIAGAIHLARIVNELATANQKLERLSMQDGLTGIGNRRALDLGLDRRWCDARGRGASIALLLVDVDHFKRLNDSCGHLYGDECLKALARECGASLELPDDLVARYGGEELMLVLPGRDLAAARQVAEALRRRVEQLPLPSGPPAACGRLTVSIGVSAASPPGGGAATALIDAADRAMYTAKARGRNRVVGIALEPATAR